MSTTGLPPLVKARVRLEIEVDASSNWNPTVTMQQVFDQAGSEAATRITEALRKADGGGVRVLSVVVTAILAEEIG